MQILVVRLNVDHPPKRPVAPSMIYARSSFDPNMQALLDLAVAADI